MAALAIGGNILGTVAGIMAAHTNAAAAKFQGQVDAYNALAQADAYGFNAKVADQQASNTRQVALAEAGDYRRAGSAALASRRAAVAAGGVVSTSGSPLLVDTNILSEIELGAGRIINRGDIVSTRQKNEATLLRGQAANATRNAKFARQAGNIGAKAANLGVYTSIAQGAIGIGNTISTSSSFG